MTSSASLVFRELALVAPAPGELRGLPLRATPASETPTPRHPCTLGIQQLNCATALAGSEVTTHFVLAATLVATSGRCGDFSRTAATTSPPTATPPSSASMTAVDPALPACF